MDPSLFGGVPRFLARPKAFSVCVGKDATLSCTVVGSPTPLITWEKDKLKLTSGGRFKAVEDGDVYRLTIYELTLEDSGQYMCRAKNSVGEAYAAVTLKVALPAEMPQRAPVFVARPSSARVAVGADVAFACRVASHPEANFEWEKDGRYLGESNRVKIVSDGDGSTLRIQSARNLDAGTYTCRAQNTVGRAHVAAALTVDVQDSRKLMADKSTSLLSHLQRRKEEMKKDISIYRSEESPLSPFSVAGFADGLAPLGLEHELRASTLATLPKGVFTRACTVTEGKHAKLSCFVTGHPKPHITWRKDGANIGEGRRHVIYEDHAENFILKILYCKQADNGLYTCNAANMAGQTYSAVLVTVKGEAATTRSSEVFFFCLFAGTLGFLNEMLKAPSQEEGSWFEARVFLVGFACSLWVQLPTFAYHSKPGIWGMISSSKLRCECECEWVFISVCRPEMSWRCVQGPPTPPPLARRQVGQAG